MPAFAEENKYVVVVRTTTLVLKIIFFMYIPFNLIQIDLKDSAYQGLAL